MKKILGLLMAAVLAATAAGVKPVAADNRIPVIHVYSDTIEKNDLAIAMAAIQIQIDRDFFPVWGYRARLSLQDSPGAWQFLLTSDDGFIPDRCYCWGVHGVFNGIPVGFGFMSRIKKYPVPWSVVMSHEILEMLADPFLDQATAIGGRIVPIETGDAVHAFGYLIDSVIVQDFVLRNYFVPGSEGPWDFLHRLSGPYPVNDETTTCPKEGCPDGIVRLSNYEGPGE